MPEAEYSPLFKVLFGVRKSILYHHRRRRFYDLWHARFTFIALVSGSATVVAALRQWGSTPLVALGLVVTLCSALDMVIGTAAKARLHNDLMRRFVALEKEIITSDVQDVAAGERFEAVRLEIEADEPPPLLVLNTICHNDVLRRQGNPKDQWIPLTWLQRFFSPYFDIQESRL